MLFESTLIVDRSPGQREGSRGLRASAIIRGQPQLCNASYPDKHLDRERDTPSRYSVAARREIERVVRAGGRPECPDCRTPMDERLVPPRPDVSYVRDRVWLTCSRCGQSLVIDRVGPSRPDTGRV